MAVPVRGQESERSARPRVRDVGLVLVLCVLDLTIFSSVAPSAPLWVYALAIAGFVPLLWRRVAPIPVFFFVLFFALGATLGSTDLRPTLALLVASYSVAASTDRKTSIALAALAIPTFVGIALLGELRQEGASPSASALLAAGLLTAMLGTAPWVLGRWARVSRGKVQDAEVAGMHAADDARLEERRQIALELHDIISHSVSVMVLQADGARAVLRTDPGAVKEALDQISQVGRSSVGELRRLLGFLSDGSLSVEDVGFQGLADLPKVIEEAERTGLHVQLEVTGRPPPVPASFERSVHRIVRETLANSRKHGGPGTEVKVCLFWSESVLVVTTSDNGAGLADDPTLSTGYGLSGLRERVRATDGRLDAGPAADGKGFVVTATLPIPVIGASSPGQAPIGGGR
jgi:signal transduction histidine kinase